MPSSHTMVVNTVGQLAGDNFCIQAPIDVIFAPLESSLCVEKHHGVRALLKNL
jgi:hypothetical protein